MAIFGLPGLSNLSNVEVTDFLENNPDNEKDLNDPTQKQAEESNHGPFPEKEKTSQSEKDYKGWKLLSQFIDRVMFVLYVGVLAVGITKYALEFRSWH